MSARGVRRFVPSSIGVRLMAGFSLVGLLLAAVAAVSVWRLHELRDQSIALMDERVPRLLLLDEVIAQVDALNGAARDALLKAEPAEAERDLLRIEAGRQAIGKKLEDLQKSFEALGEVGRERAEAFSTNSSGILVSLIKFSRAVKAGNKEAAVQLLDKTLKPKLETLAQIIRDFRDEQLHEAKRDAIDTAAQTNRIIAALVVVSLVLGSLCAVLITRSITRPLGKAVRLAEAVAAGDLSGQIKVRRTDEVGQLQRALGAMTEQLQGVIAAVRQSAEQIAAASAQIAAGNADLSSRTDEQATSLQRTAASVTHLSGAVGGSAQTAQQASQLAMASSDAAQRGGQMMQQVIATMGQITDSSKRIADITGVIDGIAFQTNILALNAAVEAARAGEQGRGFAVVAAEVRSLAQRSAEAAKQIKSLIGASVERIEAGDRLVGDAGAAMQQILSGAQRVTDLIGEISAAAAEQSGDIVQVDSAVSQLDRVTQQNAALVEQSAAAAQALQEQAARLVQTMSVFRVA